MSDDDSMFGTKEKKSRSAKTGRRAKKAAEPPPDVFQGVDEDEATEEVLGPSDSKQSVGLELDDGPPKPSRRLGGWGSEPSASRHRGGDDLEDERLKPMNQEMRDEESDSDPDIPIIPDLEDHVGDDLTTQVAMAPNVAVNRVATFRELDNDLLRHAAFLTLDNEIDMKLLSKSLSPEADVQEEDVGWEWDRLFTEVTSELLTEWENKDEANEESALPIA